MNERKPANHGKRWEAPEENYIIREILAGKPIPWIALNLKRTNDSVRNKVDFLRAIGKLPSRSQIQGETVREEYQTLAGFNPEKMRNIRESRGMTLEDLSKRLPGLPVKAWESGQLPVFTTSRTGGLSPAQRLASALGCDVEDLTGPVVTAPEEPTFDNMEAGIMLTNLTANQQEQGVRLGVIESVLFRLAEELGVKV